LVLIRYIGVETTPYQHRDLTRDMVTATWKCCWISGYSTPDPYFGISGYSTPDPYFVDGVEGAIAHIAQYGSQHSEAIITENYSTAEHFLNAVDAACVYLNASTQFTDGGEFGFGAEVGISTNKLHARGPMGVTELTTYKYKIYGNGEVR